MPVNTKNSISKDHHFESENSIFNMIKHVNYRYNATEKNKLSESSPFDLLQIYWEQNILEDILCHIKINNIDLEFMSNSDISDYLERLKAEHTDLIIACSRAQDSINTLKLKMLQCKQEINRIEVFAFERN